MATYHLYVIRQQRKFIKVPTHNTTHCVSVLTTSVIQFVMCHFELDKYIAANFFLCFLLFFLKNVIKLFLKESGLLELINWGVQNHSIFLLFLLKGPFINAPTCRLWIGLY